MTVLGVETATAVCAAAVAVDGAVVAERSLEQHAVHAEKLLTLVDGVLRDAGISATNADGIAVSIGPGSFTGLRIGLSVAKGLAYATGRPLLAVPTLEALAWRAAEAGMAPGFETILAVLDARRDEVYCQLFGTGEGRPSPIGDARACTLPELAGDLRDRQVVLTGDAREKVFAFLRAVPEFAGRVRLTPHEFARCSAGTVARLGSVLLEEGSAEEPGALEPRYIKEFFLRAR